MSQMMFIFAADINQISDLCFPTKYWLGRYREQQIEGVMAKVIQDNSSTKRRTRFFHNNLGALIKSKAGGCRLNFFVLFLENLT